MPRLVAPYGMPCKQPPSSLGVGPKTSTLADLLGRLQLHGRTLQLDLHACCRRAQATLRPTPSLDNLQLLCFRADLHHGRFRFPSAPPQRWMKRVEFEMGHRRALAKKRPKNRNLPGEKACFAGLVRTGLSLKAAWTCDPPVQRAATFSFNRSRAAHTCQASRLQPRHPGPGDLVPKP